MLELPESAIKPNEILCKEGRSKASQTPYLPVLSITAVEKSLNEEYPKLMDFRLGRSKIQISKYV